MNAYRHFLVNQLRHTADPAYDPPPEPEYFLKDCPRGYCPWCKNVLFDGGTSPVITACLHCFDYDDDMTQDENRIRYAAERLADAQVRQP